MFEIAIALGAFSFGFAIAWVIGARTRETLASAESRLALLQEQASQRARDMDALRDERERLVESVREESSRRSAAEAQAARVPALEQMITENSRALSKQQADLKEIETRMTEQQKAAEEKLKLIAAAEQALSNAFKGLSAEALQQNNQSFLDLATTHLGKFQETARGELEARQKAVDQLVQPIRESLQKVDGKLGEMEKTRESAYAALNEQLRGLVETHIPMLRGETANLVKALRQPQVRGRWGEIQLRRVVEMAGMLEYCDFQEQQSLFTEDGRVRPDLIVKLPGGKQIIIDAKAPVTAYLEAAEAADDDARKLHLENHARQVRAHMTALGRKAYWDTFDPSPEFVIMFLPGEMFFSAALQQDPGLIEFGVYEKVVPATPTTLIALLRAVAYGWRQEALALNAQEVAQLGKQLYERISTLAGHWSDVGQKLDRAVEAYNRSVVTLESRVLVSARRFKELRAAPDTGEMEAADQVEAATRALQAPEMVVKEPAGTG